MPRLLGTLALVALGGGCSAIVNTNLDRLDPSDGGDDSDVGTDAIPCSTCTPPGMCCGDFCVDLTTSSANCGRCGNACPGGGPCIGGRCDCGPTGIVCGTECVDRSADPRNCGSCGSACPQRRYCTDFACACRPHLATCTGSCRDLATDPNNCGVCGVVCPAVCFFGVCSATCGALTNCSRGCVDLRNDPLNCGECGRPCSSWQLCMNGTCSDYTVPLSDPPCSSNPCAPGVPCCNYPGTDRTICLGAPNCP